MNATKNKIAETNQATTIDNKEIDKILDWLVDNRNNTTAIVFIAKNNDGQKSGASWGIGYNIEDLFYSMLKHSDDTVDLMLAAMEKYTNEIEKKKNNENR